MALSSDKIAKYYPLPVYNYKVSVGGNDMSFSEVTGLSVEYEKIEYRHGFSWLMGDNLIRARRNPVNLTLKRGIVKDRDQLYKWLEGGDKRDLKIDLCDEKGAPVVTWQVLGALPLKMELPSFNASTSEVALESLALIAHQVKLALKDESATELAFEKLNSLLG